MVRIASLLVIVAVTAAACGGTSAQDGGGDWLQLRRAPIAERVNAEIAVVAGEVFVFGGSDDYCPPSADCAQPDWPPFSDGAAFDLETRTWRTIADAPVGIEHASTVAVGTNLHVAWMCIENGRCPTGSGMLRYSTTADRWERLSAIPAERGWFELVVVDGAVFAIAGSTDFADVGDWKYDHTDDEWERLPDTPSGPGYDRFGLDVAGTLHVFESIRDLDGVKAAAAFDADARSWTPLAESPEAGFQAWLVGDDVYLNPHFAAGGGGIYDTDTNTWRTLPNTPRGDEWRDMAGVLNHDEAVFAATRGWVLDADAEEWFEITERDELWYSGEAILAVGDEMFVVGGLAFTDEERPVWSGAWLWTR